MYGVYKKESHGVLWNYSMKFREIFSRLFVFLFTPVMAIISIECKKTKIGIGFSFLNWPQWTIRIVLTFTKKILLCMSQFYKHLKRVRTILWMTSEAQKKVHRVMECHSSLWFSCPFTYSIPAFYCNNGTGPDKIRK